MMRALPLVCIAALVLGCNSPDDARPEPPTDGQVPGDAAVADPEANDMDGGWGEGEAGPDLTDAVAEDGATAADASVADDGSATVDAQPDGDSGGQCIAGLASLRAVTAELLVVFDASGSTREEPAGVDCRKAATNPTYNVICLGLGIDCSLPLYAQGQYCGGPPIDRFGPAAQVVKAIAAQLDTRVPTGLMVFPAPSSDAQQCLTGNELVVPRLSSAAEVAAKLDAVQPNGSSPVAATLRRALERIQTRTGSAMGETRRSVVLLVTDGAPTCASSSSQALTETLAAIDDLKAAQLPVLVLAHEDRLSSAEQSSLTALAARAGATTYWRTQQQDALAAELDRVAHAPSCWFELETTLPAGADLRVKLDGFTLVKDSPGGYILHERRLTLRGQACELMTDGRVHALEAQRVCP